MLVDIFEHANDSFFVVDPKTSRFIEVNENAASRLGYSKEELLQLTIPDITAAESLPSIPEAMSGLEKTGSSTFEQVHQCKDGKTIPVEISAKLINYGDRKVYLATVRDITERKKQKEALEYSDELFRQLADNTEQVFWVTSLNPEKVLYVSHGYERIWGRKVEELYNNPHLWMECIHADDQLRIEQAFGDWLSGKRADYEVEYRIVSTDGTIHWIGDKGNFVRDDDGNILRITGIASDISEKKQHLLELENDHSLFDAMSQAQSSFIADVAPKELFNDLLTELLNLTQSEYGFIGQVLYDEDGHPYLKTFALTNIAWDKETLEFYEQNAPEGLEFRNLNSLFGAVMVTADTVISNDPANDPRGCGIPKGHPPLNAFLGIPFIIGDQLLGMAGVSNRSGGYDQDIIKFLKPLALSCGQMINAFNKDTARKQAEEYVDASEGRLSGILDSTAEAVISVDESQHIILFNKGAEETFGYRQNEILGQPLDVLLPVTCRPTHHSNVTHFAKSPERARYMGDRHEIEGRRKNGETFPAEASISKLELNGKKTFTAVLRDISERKKAENKLVNSFTESIYTLMRAAEYRDDETGAHVRRISHYTKALAEALGMDDDFCKDIFYASAMHDIGKIGIPDDILLKPGGFTPEEWEIMKTHTIIGGSIMRGNSSPYLQLGEQIALSHHERWDGGGYPNGIKGDAIPLAARIMQLADVYDALRSKRPYKKAFDHEKSLEIITKGDGRTDPSHFDPAVLAAFQQCADTMNKIFEEHSELERS